MSWNLRLVKETFNKGTDTQEDFYSIREVFYNEKDEIFAYSENPVNISGESIENIKEYLKWCLECLEKPILVDGEVTFARSDD